MDFIVKLSGTHSEASTKFFGRGVSTFTSALVLGFAEIIVLRTGMLWTKVHLKKN